MRSLLDERVYIRVASPRSLSLSLFLSRNARVSPIPTDGFCIERIPLLEALGSREREREREKGEGGIDWGGIRCWSSEQFRRSREKRALIEHTRRAMILLDDIIGRPRNVRKV